MSRYYFICTVRFMCNACGKISIESIGSDSTDADPSKVAAVVTKQKLFCQLCNKRLTEGSQVDLHIDPVTIQKFKDAGFTPSLDS